MIREFKQISFRVKTNGISTVIAETLSIKSAGKTVRISGLQVQEELKRISAAVGFPLSFDNVKELHSYLSILQNDYTDYYKKLLEFKWTCCQISFPVFDLVKNVRLESDWLISNETGSFLCQHEIYKYLKKTLSYIPKNDKLFSGLMKELYNFHKNTYIDHNLRYNPDNMHSLYVWRLPEYGCDMEYIPVDGIAFMKPRQSSQPLPPSCADRRQYREAKSIGGILCEGVLPCDTFKIYLGY